MPSGVNTVVSAMIDIMSAPMWRSAIWDDRLKLTSETMGQPITLLTVLVPMPAIGGGGKNLVRVDAHTMCVPAGSELFFMSTT
eukprot:1175443-Prorocentrum_minimum.AAC.2